MVKVKGSGKSNYRASNKVGFEMVKHFASPGFQNEMIIEKGPILVIQVSIQVRKKDIPIIVLLT